MKKFLKGFVYALNGIMLAFKEERNFRFHFIFALWTFWFSTFYDFNKYDYVIVILCVFLMLGFELLNSAVERSVDKPDALHYDSAGFAKDLAAGAVLVVALCSIICGIILFFDINIIINIINWHISKFYITIPAWVLSFIFIFRIEEN